MKKVDLCGEWKFQDESGVWHEGIVPGCVHTDLFSASEMFWEKNSEKCQFIENQDWIYVKEFQIDEIGEDAELVFEGLDTYCDIYLNDEKLGSTDNMFIPHKFSIDGILRKGVNTLKVRFFSPIKAVEGKEKLVGNFTTERLHSRRMQCTYSWDWVERFVTCGIYRPVYILFHDKTELEHVYVFADNIDAYSAQIKITEHFRGYEAGALIKTEVLNPEGEVIQRNESWCQEEESILYFDIDNPKLWYPHTYGEQPLYTLRITVGEQVTCQKFGIRTVKILQLKDRGESAIEKCRNLQVTPSGMEWDKNEEYSGFILLVNGVRIFCTGANWVPCEPFPSAETEEKITRNLEMGVQMGINMLRVWGGGLFEKQHLYDECDRLGILVTQDFLMACGEYPETDETFQEQLGKEAEFAAVYLRNHPSLVWWTGDNENAVAGDDTKENYCGRLSARKVIAPVLEKLDCNRRFLFSSPYGGKLYASKTVGTTHNTNFLWSMFCYFEKEDLSDYREKWKEYLARFIAEEPIMGAVCKTSYDEFVAPENQSNHDMWIHHSKGNPGLPRELFDYMDDFAKGLFGEYKDFEDHYFKLRYLQYEWIRFTMGYARSNLWFNSGVVYWMFNDCWPAFMGWALIDYYLRPKSGYYAMQHYAKSVANYIEKTANGYQLHVSNILPQKASYKAEVFVLDMVTNERKQLLKEEMTVCAESITREFELTLGGNEILIAETKTKEDTLRNWYREGAPCLERTNNVQYQITDDGVEVWSDKYIHVVEIERAEKPSDNYFSLLPGEKRKITYEKAVKGEVEISAHTFGICVQDI